MSAEPALGWRQPREFLYAWEFARDCAQFLPLERETLVRSSFLDRRIAADLSGLRRVPIGEVLASTGKPADGPQGFVFHTAFCCSTLLARSLDSPGQVLALREPATLLQLADLARGLTSTSRDLDTLLEATLALLARPLAPGEKVLIKPGNVVNNLIGPLMHARPSARGIVLYDDLEPFLLSVLKRPRESQAGVQGFLERLLRDFPGRPPRPAPQGLAQAAALAWHLETEQLRAALAGPAAARLRLLRTDRLLSRPAASLAAAAQWLGLGLDRAHLAEVVSGPLWRSHAKDPAVAFGPERRRREQSLARRLAAHALADGLGYAGRIGASESPALPPSLHLPDADGEAP